MYNAIGLDNGELALAFLAMADLELEKIPRFRDCYPSKNGNAIIVYTRTGGLNREDYEEELEALYSKKNFVNDYDDDFDNTYMSLEFTPLPKYKKMLEDFVSNHPQASATGAEKFSALLKALEDGAANKDRGKDDK